jgi:kynurenine formamidase
VTRPAPFGFRQVVFLSHVLTPATPVFPGDRPVQVEPAATVAADGFYLQRIACGEQSGTHWAAPAHFGPGELAADQLDPADFFHPAAVIDVRARAAADPDFALGVGDIARWEAASGPVPPGAAVLLCTGYADRWDDPAAYLGTDQRTSVPISSRASRTAASAEDSPTSTAPPRMPHPSSCPVCRASSTRPASSAGSTDTAGRRSSSCPTTARSLAMCAAIPT